jgi:hypothetical protein
MNTTATLLARRQRLLDALPPMAEILRGSFFVRHRRCGKPSCHCATGPGHRSAVVGVTFHDGTTEQITVPPHLEPLARRWVRNYQRLWKAIEQLSALNRELLRRRLVEPDQQRWVMAYNVLGWLRGRHLRSEANRNMTWRVLFERVRLALAMDELGDAQPAAQSAADA